MNDNFDYRAYLKSNRLQSLDTQKVKKLIKENLDDPTSSSFKEISITPDEFIKGDIFLRNPQYSDSKLIGYKEEWEVKNIDSSSSNKDSNKPNRERKIDVYFTNGKMLPLTLTTLFKIKRKREEVNEILKSKIKEHISSFFEAKKKEKEPEEEIDLGDEEIGDEIPAEDIEGDVAPEEGGEGGAPEGLTADEKAIQDSLKLAYDNAVQIGDDKLSKQIGNTITMFTRSHVVGAGGMMEEVEEDTKSSIENFKPRIKKVVEALESIHRDIEESGPIDDDFIEAEWLLKSVLSK